MYRLKLCKIIILCFIIGSCSSHRHDYSAVSATFNNLKTPFRSIPVDTVVVTDYQLNFNAGLLNGYKLQKDIALNNKLIKSSANLFKWADKKYEWIMTDSDIDYMMQSLNKQKKTLMVCKRI